MSELMGKVPYNLSANFYNILTVGGIVIALVLMALIVGWYAKMLRLMKMDNETIGGMLRLKKHEKGKIAIVMVVLLLLVGGAYAYYQWSLLEGFTEDRSAFVDQHIQKPMEKLPVMTNQLTSYKIGNPAINKSTDVFDSNFKGDGNYYFGDYNGDYPTLYKVSASGINTNALLQPEDKHHPDGLLVAHKLNGYAVNSKLYVSQKRLDNLKITVN